MKHRTWIWMTAALAGIAACSEDGVTTGVCEAGQAAMLCVAQTALVDVLDFP